jgi:hypothetical protein
MAHKRQGQLTVSGEWARHLRPFGRRAFWKGERAAEKVVVRDETTPVTSVQSDVHPGNDGDRINPKQDR